MLRDVCHLRDAGTNYARADDIPEHLAIIRPLLEGGAERAARAMDRHIRSASVTLAKFDHPLIFREADLDSTLCNLDRFSCVPVLSFALRRG